MGLVSGALAIAGLLVLRSDARSLFDDLTSGAGLVAVLISAVGGLATVALVWGGRYEPARASAALAVAAIVAGWGLAQRPDLLPGLMIREAAAGRGTLVALLISIAVGLVFLVPSLGLLFGLVLRGRFDETAPTVEEEEPQPSASAWRAPRAGIAVALLVAGAALTFLGEGALIGVGVVALIGFVAIGAAELLRPGTLD